MFVIQIMRNGGKSWKDFNGKLVLDNNKYVASAEHGNITHDRRTRALKFYTAEEAERQVSDFMRRVWTVPATHCKRTVLTDGRVRIEYTRSINDTAPGKFDKTTFIICTYTPRTG